VEFEELGAGEALRQALESVGRSRRVVVCGPPDELGDLEEFADEDERSPREILEAARGIDVAGWFRGREAEVREGYAGVDVEGEWPGRFDGPRFTLNTDLLTGGLLPSVAVARLEVDAPWEIPAHFRFGGYNECPVPEEHCAVWERWHERYGAHIVGVSHAVVEAVVERPPMTQEEAMRLAWEQYWYCTDLVHQGVESVANLAAGLLGGSIWYFWWD
jgi:hypothetical protein